MKHRIIWSTLSITVVALLLLTIDFPGTNTALNPKLRYDLRSAPGRMAYEFEQKIARRAKGESHSDKYDNPDKAMALEVADRSEIGQAYSYTGSYRFRALRQALSNLNSPREVLPWVERGPGNVGGRTRALLVYPDSNSVWLVGAVGGGIWKSNDAGLSWRSVSDSLPILSVTALAQCLSQPEIMYAGTGEGFYNFDAVIGDGLFKSLDGGESWQQLASTVDRADFKYINRVIVSPNDPDLLIAATNTSLQRSTDGGLSWTQVHSPAGRVQQIIANPDNFGTQYAAVHGSGVIKSTDAGETWFPAANFGVSFGRLELALAPSDTNVLYAALASSNAALEGLYRSSDGGESWTDLGNSPNWLGSQGWYDNTLVVSPYDENEVIAGGLDLYRIQAHTTSMTATKLSNWYAGAGYPYVHADQHMLVTIPLEGNAYALLAGNDGGVFYSADNGQTWEDRDNGYNVTQFYDADKHPVLNIFVGGTQDNGTNLSPQNSMAASSWDEVIGGDGFECAWNPVDGNVVYGSLYYSRLFKSEDGGQNFFSLGNGLPESSIFYTSLAMAPQNPDVLLVVGNGNLLYRTWNGGDSWSAITGDFSRSSKKIHFSGANSDIVWATTISSEINVSTDNGHSFHGISTPPNAPNSSVLGIGTHPDRDSTAFVTFGVSDAPKIFRTDDLGESWIDLTSDLPDIPVYALIVMPFDTSRIWIGTDIGLFESLDGGSSWNYAANGIPAVSIRKLKIVGQEIVAATHGRGIWSVHLDELPVLETPTLPPLLSELLPPPPNLPRIQINFSTRSAHDSLKVLVNDSSITTYEAVSAYSNLSTAYRGEYGDSLSIQVVGYSEGLAYTSERQELLLFAPVSSYLESFDNATTSMTGDMTVGPLPDFDSNLLQTYHPYGSSQNYITYVGPPIIIDETSTMSYRDIALIEPGEPGSAYPQQIMWDYVTVEGSLDGTNWDILIEPYDCRFDAGWTQLYNSGADPTHQHLREHQIPLNESYASGDTVSLRFRLFADEAVTGWGWAIEDLAILSTTDLSDAGVRPVTFALLPNFPNPFNGSTTLPFTVGSTGRVSLTLFDIRGRKIRTLIRDQVMRGGQVYSVDWQAADDQGRGVASGLYILRLDYPAGSLSRKITLLK